ncbi:hypothetical protein C8J56DRAFT_1165266 [Mycena floridula]|nr:hypothetical protein C8J56DRAFT_1165266 [Mycena floridula]
MSDNSTSSVPTDGNPYAPQEPVQLIITEKYDFIGMHLADMLYGVTVILFFRCMIGILLPRHGRARKPWMAVYTLVLFGLATIFTGMNLQVSRLGFIDDRNFPGGPEAYQLFLFSTPLALTPNIVFILANWLADALLMFRCKVIWDKWWILVVPGILFLGSLSMGIITIYQSCQPNANLWTKVTFNFALAYFSTATTLNILLTILICARLVLHQRNVKGTRGFRSKLPYSSVITMLVESSAIYAVSSAIFIGTYAAQNPASTLFLSILSQTQVIGPLLIIARVVNQKAWVSTNSKGNSNSAPFSGFQESTVDVIPMQSQLSSPNKTVFVAHEKEGSFGSAA